MQLADYLTVLNVALAFLGVLVAALGVAFVFLAWFEWRKLRQIQAQINMVKGEFKRDIYLTTQAAHRVMASYGVANPDRRIALLQSALRIDPAAFNAWNGIGYACLEKGELDGAVDAFGKAIRAHADDKAGYCDMAYAQLRAGNADLALKYARQAISKDASAREDLLADERFEMLHDRL